MLIYPRLPTSREAADAHISEITHLREAADASTSERETLKSRLASVEDAEVDAQVRWGATDLLLGHIWAEKEDLRERLAEIESAGPNLREMNLRYLSMQARRRTIGIVKVRIQSCCELTAATAES